MVFVPIHAVTRTHVKILLPQRKTVTCMMQERIVHTINASLKSFVAFATWAGSSTPSGDILKKLTLSSAAKNFPNSSSLKSPVIGKSCLSKG